MITAGGIIIGCNPAERPSLEEIIRLAWFYKPPENGRLDRAAQNFDFFILRYQNENERDELKAKGITSPFSQYLLFLVINDPEGCDENPNENDESYQKAVEGFLACIRQNYFEPGGKPLYPNIVSVDEEHVWVVS